MAWWHLSGLAAKLGQVRADLLLRRAIADGLVIGKDVRIAGFQRFSSEPYLISVGNHVAISGEVELVTHDGGTWVFRDEPEYQGLQRFGRIDIEDNCFIGAGSILLPGIRVGPNSVVGAASVVTKSVPPNTVVAGVPAKHICNLEEYIARSVPRCQEIPPDVVADRKKLKQFLLDRLPVEPPDQMSWVPERPFDR